MRWFLLRRRGVGGGEGVVLVRGILLGGCFGAWRYPLRFEPIFRKPWLDLMSSLNGGL